MSKDKAIINLTDQRAEDDRRLRDHLLASQHVNDNDDNEKGSTR